MASIYKYLKWRVRIMKNLSFKNGFIYYELKILKGIFKIHISSFHHQLPLARC